MMRDQSEPGITTPVDVTFEVYLKNRDEPVLVNATFEIRPDLLEEGCEVEDFSQLTLKHVLATIDVVREHRLILSDRLHNKSIFLTDEIQGISIHAPSETMLLQQLEG